MNESIGALVAASLLLMKLASFAVAVLIGSLSNQPIRVPTAVWTIVLMSVR
jgi:hypothetical protein